MINRIIYSQRIVFILLILVAYTEFAAAHIADSSRRNKIYFPIGMCVGFQIRTLNSNIKCPREVGDSVPPFMAEDKIYRNAFMASNGFCPMIGITWSGKKMNFHDISFAFNAFRSKQIETPYAQLGLTSKYYVLQYAYARPISKILYNKFLISPVWGLKSKFIYSLNKYSFQGRDQGNQWDMDERDEAWMILPSIALGLRFNPGTLAMTLGYDFSPVAWISMNHKMSILDDPMPHYTGSSTLTETKSNKRYLIGPGEMSRSRLLYQNLQFSMIFTFF
ncbi:MAG: hypothetical protein WCM76_04300 [Bacteroidota bacterium]